MRVLELKPADIFLTRGEGWLSRSIRFFETSARERLAREKTLTNHTGIVVEGGSLNTAVVVEALSNGVQQHTLRYSYAGESDLVQIWRPRNIPIDVKLKIADHAKGYVGRKYGWSKIALHVLGLERLARFERFPICSYVVGRAFEMEGYTFGSPGNAVDPDDISDFVEQNRDKYELIMDWRRLE